MLKCRHCLFIRLLQVIMIAYVYGGYKPADIYQLYYHFNLISWLQVRWVNWFGRSTQKSSATEVREVMSSTS